MEILRWAHTSLAAWATLAQGGQQAVHPSLVTVQDDPGLPRVLLIGDSISMGYTCPVRALLQGTANVHHIPENGGATTRGVANLSRWLEPGPWDVIYFNFGLHDLKYMPDGTRQVPADEYEKNLMQITSALRQTGARLIWASTTPVPQGDLSPIRHDADVVAYNALAQGIMDHNGILISDLYSLALPRLPELQQPVNVHFSEYGSRMLAGWVADSIEQALS